MFLRKKSYPSTCEKSLKLLNYINEICVRPFSLLRDKKSNINLNVAQASFSFYLSSLSLTVLWFSYQSKSPKF